jgi:hypothetical protein
LRNPTWTEQGSREAVATWISKRSLTLEMIPVRRMRKSMEMKIE